MILFRLFPLIRWVTSIFPSHQYKPWILANGGQVLMAAENGSLLEGSVPTAHTTVLEFPSREAAETLYHSNDYNAIKHLRHEA